MDRQGGKLASVVESVTVEVGEGGGGRIELRRGRIRQRRRWRIRCIDRATALDSTVGDGILRTRNSDGSDGSGTKCHDPNQIDGFAGVHAWLGARRWRRLEQATEGGRGFRN